MDFLDLLMGLIEFYLRIPLWVDILFIVIEVSLYFILKKKIIPKLKEKEKQLILSKYSYLMNTCTVELKCEIIDVVQIDKLHFYPIVYFEYNNQGYTTQLHEFILYNISMNRPSNNKILEKLPTSLLVLSGILDNFKSPEKRDLYYRVRYKINLCINPYNLNEYYSSALLNEYISNLEHPALMNKKLFYLDILRELCFVMPILSVVGLLE